MTTVGDVKAAVRDLDDAAVLYVQVVAEDGTTWLMRGSLEPVAGSQPRSYVFLLTSSPD